VRGVPQQLLGNAHRSVRRSARFQDVGIYALLDTTRSAEMHRVNLVELPLQITTMKDSEERSTRGVALSTLFPVEPPPPARKPDPLVDFVRGLGLWIIYVDHIYPNVCSNLTLQAFGFSDFAEIFVFVSAYLGAAMYQRALAAGGFPAAIAKLRLRVARLYVAHILTMSALLLLLWLFDTRGTSLNNQSMYAWVPHPAEYGVRILTLMYAPPVAALLPLYILAAPLILGAVWGLSRAPRSVVAFSALVWLAGQFRALDLPVMTRDEAWFFRPLAWQFLFVIGVASRLYSDQWLRFALQRWVIRLELCVVAVAFLLKMAARVPAAVPALVHLGTFARVLGREAGKAHLSPFRLMHFLCLLGLFVVFSARHRQWLSSWPARVAIAYGQNSLLIYCLGVLLATAANLVLVADGGAPMQVAITVLGLVLQCAIAWPLRARTR